MKGERYIDPSDFLIPENMIEIYAQGAFPMADEDGTINWYQPELRTVILPEKFNIPRSLKKFMVNSDFDYRFDFMTMEIVKNCADRNETWISAELIEAYEGLKKIGHLHSVAVMQNNKLVGGLYGVNFRGAFFGESMFSKVSQASKCALVKLVERLKEKGFLILDVQFQTEHLKMFGTEEISFEQYAKILTKAYSDNISFEN